MMNEIAQTLIELAKKFAHRLQVAWGENLVSVVLYGSVARSECHKDSDVDLLVIAEKLPKSRLERTRLLLQQRETLRDEVLSLEERGYHPRLSCIAKTREEAEYHSPLYLDMTEDALILYDKGAFFQGVLDEMRARMREYGSRRIWLEGGWYWDLKPDYKYGDIIEI